MPKSNGYKYVQIDLNDVKKVDAFSFITGSQNTLPLTWILQGSIDGSNWVPLYTQSSPFNYTHVASGMTTNASNAFYNPGIFPFMFTGQPQGSTQPAEQSISYGNAGQDIEVEGFRVASTSKGNSTVKFKESFVAPIESSYTLPLKVEPKPNSKFQELRL